MEVSIPLLGEGKDTELSLEKRDSTDTATACLPCAGLNILPQKSWNVYGRENRLKVARDEAKHEEEQRVKAEKQRLVGAHTAHMHTHATWSTPSQQQLRTTVIASL